MKHYKIVNGKITFARWAHIQTYDLDRVVRKMGGINHFNTWLNQQYVESFVQSDFSLILYVSKE